jgi:hypothetical protein
MAPHAEREHTRATALNTENVNKKKLIPGGAASGLPVPPRDMPEDVPPKTNRTRSEAQRDYWRDVKSGKRIRNEKPAELPKAPDHNPIFDLPEAERLKLYARLRDCPLTEVIQAILEEHGVPPVTRDQVNEFFAVEAENLWEVRTLRAVTEANALVRFAEKTDENIPAGILAALGQQTFKLVAAGADPAQISRLATLFIKMRSDSRANQMQGLKRRKVEHALGDDMHAAFRKLAEEVDRCPAAQEHFDALQRALAESAEEGE